MDKKTAPLVILAIVLCAVIVLGEVFTYGINTHSFDSKADFSSGTLNYSVSSSGSDTYSVVLIDENSAEPVRDLHIYVDERYDDYYSDVQKKSGLLYMQEQYYSEQIKKHLDFRGFEDVTLVKSDGLIEFINNTYENPKGHGLFVTSYALPSEIYCGNADDRLMKWIENGGYLYWSSSEIGKYYTDGSGLHEVSDNQILFFGKECVNTGKLENATCVVDNDFRTALTLQDSGLKFALDTSDIPDSLSVGYCEDGYSSISFVRHGSGMICVIGTMTEIIPQMEDTAQIIASGLTYASVIVDSVKGDVVRGSVSGSLDYSSIGNIRAYIYIGGTYTLYGRSYHD